MFVINWKVRIRNKAFWAALIPAVFLLIQNVASAFGYRMDLTEMGEQFMAAVNQLFAVLTIVGVVNDPTTAGLEDSKQAMGYDVPKRSE